MTVGALTGVVWIDEIGRSLREGFFMFWVTLWPLILGFGLSGAVQAFASREGIQRKLGDHRPRSIARASGYGMVSSSCSYAASAMSKSLFAKGADFVASMVFMFASTNLVVELGIVLVVLMGWQFAVSEFVGGAIMIVLLVAVGGLYFRGRLVVQARDRLQAEERPSIDEHRLGGHEGASAETHAHDHHVRDEEQSGPATSPDRLPTEPHARESWRTRVRSASGWSDAAGYTMADFTMLRKELVVGFVVAGFLSELVPVTVWNALFIHGHGFWTTLENVMIGPFIALISFVCSIGNVPLAAALWHGGISFGGVVSFIFADLITLPLLLIYRKQYGGGLALRMLMVFWGVMSLAGLITELIFDVAGLIPTTRHTQVVATRFSWNYTTYLNIIFIVVFGVLYWLHRNRERFGGGTGYAVDPMCGMQVETAHAPANTTHHGRKVFFCSDRCRERFLSNPPERVSGGSSRAPSGAERSTTTGTPPPG